MARRPQTNPRKTASQERSRLTIEALLEATARVLVKEGYDRASTNKIATVAGVSIGSLYQYFPSKEALVAGVVERHSHELSQITQHALVKIAARPVPVAVRELVSISIDAHRVNPKLHGVLSEQVPRSVWQGDIGAVNPNLYALVRAYFAAHGDEIDVVDHDMAAFICVTAVEALTHAAVLHRPDMLTGERAARFVDEVTRLVVRHLRKR
jgi:AcrR family transcriptional regulator